MTSVNPLSAALHPRVYSHDASRGVQASAGFRPELQTSGPVTPISVTEVEKAATPTDAAKEDFSAGKYNAEEREKIAAMRARDAEVRAHEQAHKSAGGQYVGTISYEYQTGPDGKLYAVGGSVPIDTTPEDEPEATIAKMDIIIDAALAPVEPSTEDRAIAQLAQKQLTEAEGDLRAERSEERNEALNALKDTATSTDTALDEAMKQYTEQVSAAKTADLEPVKISV